MKELRWNPPVDASMQSECDLTAGCLYSINHKKLKVDKQTGGPCRHIGIKTRSASVNSVLLLCLFII